MTPDEAIQAVNNRSRVRIFSAADHSTVGEGQIIGYSIVPTVTIILDNGNRMTWRHDLAEVVAKTEEEDPLEGWQNIMDAQRDWGGRQ